MARHPLALPISRIGTPPPFPAINFSSGPILLLHYVPRSYIKQSSDVLCILLLLVTP